MSPAPGAQPAVWLDHVTVITEHFAPARAVYDALCAALGLLAELDYQDPEEDGADSGTVAVLGYRTAEHRLLLVLAAGAASTRGAHFALAVPDRRLIDEAVAAAAAAGARIVQPPREWESRQLGYYGAQLSDVDGNLIELVHRPTES
ncbi:MAG: Glyoxalase/bleomycin resistance protein/dioxygenase [Frankiales bacterium]|nr:Glyoxalase/bleomycin resistance protein/dioxygenase [Frankiales bacterium]